MEYVIIDMQGFRDNSNKFILKEIAILSSNDEIQHFIIRSPYSWHYLDAKAKTTNKWLTKNHHGLQWSDGKTHFCDVIKFLKCFVYNFKIIYVKGKEKKKLA